jgi:hypothetical protein
MMLINMFCCDLEILAYLDPGFGSYIFQMLIAGLVGTGFAVKLFWTQIKQFIASVLNKKDNNA